MRIAVISNYYPPKIVGGAEVYVAQLVAGLRERGHDVLVVTNCPGVSFAETNVHNIDLPANPVLLGLLVEDRRIDRAMKAVLAKFAPNVVHIHNTHSSLGFGTYRAASSWPIVVTVHDYQLFCLIGVNYRYEGKTCNERTFCASCARSFYPREGATLGLSGWRRFVTELLGRSQPLARLLVWLRNRGRHRTFSSYVTRVLCVSDSVERTMRAWNVPPSKLFVLPNGIVDGSAPVRSQSGARSLQIGFIGRLTEAKGAHILIAALEKLYLVGVDFNLTIAGSGESFDRLQETARERLPKRVRFLGHLDRTGVELFYEAVDIVVVPSVWPDPLPVVIVEAMSRAKVVVGADIGGIAGMLEGQAGVIFRSGDPVDLARVLETLVDRSHREAIALSARSRFESRYRLDPHVAKVERIYFEAISERV